MIEYRESLGGVGGDGKTLYGLVTPFDTWTTIGDLKRGGFHERVGGDAFAKTLAERDVVLINGHDANQPMARTSVAEGEGSLTLTPTPGEGLRCVGLPTDTSYARDVLVNAKAGVIRGMSFGFEVIRDAWTDEAGNPSDKMRGTRRTILEVRLHEVTTTAFPAYTTTHLSARARGETEELLQERAAYQAAEARSAAGSAETRDDPDGDEYAAMRLAIAQLRAGHVDEAIHTLQASLPEGDEGGSADSDAEESERAADTLALHRSLTLEV